MLLEQKELGADDFVAQLRSLGVVEGDRLMVHASMKALGPMTGGAMGVAEGLLAAVGPSGTLMAYVSWDHSPYEETLGGASMTIAERDAWPVFDPADAPPYSGWGILNTYLLRLPGARRSGNPDASMAAVGKDADYLIADHPLGTGYGPGSPLERFVKLGGKVLMLGAPLDSVTLLHYTEAVADIPGKRWVTYEVPVLRDGRKSWEMVRELDSNGIIDVYAREGEPDAVETIATAYVAEGRHREGRVGQAHCYLFDATDLHKFGLDYLETRHGSGQ
ncbi:aminoglycoside 3-N-acetyltransferase [Devosia sediminis]|uniref:Aminoglycoside N(3)-acetyltransferase n=1 Tax=Devosia sediminis TaxID=2798801 RepID=A0A934MH59_9HYPH|nr:aminoglycoside 3-N-acetyltransferase [Devosia sediminis]MBJ3784712.1 aminoglycoside 3-N-acetyltransferase [Devosia sediminis]